MPRPVATLNRYWGLSGIFVLPKFIAVDPTMLLSVYSNNTSLLSFILTFLHGIEMS